ncbi:MAG TPA: site-2 protease family protein [Candidatus Baltobacteraceae bacterium]|nr:site-2 protease family protein [Candidatus Baltobacteraceae bacterium]
MNQYPTGWAERDEQKQYDVVEGEYQAPQPAQQQRTQNRAKGWGAIGLAIAALLAKFKTILLVLLNLKWFAVGLKLLWFAGSFLASVWFYALFWGWKFGLVFVLLIAVHEFGHWFTMRFYGVPSSLPFFIPGMGALVNMTGRPASAFHESLIALAGPLVGGLGSAVCAYIGFATHEPFWLAAAYLGMLINLFNLAPVMPLDGGRIVGSISPRIWVGGLAVFVAAMIVMHLFNPLILILIVVSIPQVIAAWKGRLDPHYYGVTLPQRLTITCAYFALAALLFAGMLSTHVSVPGHAIVQ